MVIASLPIPAEPAPLLPSRPIGETGARVGGYLPHFLHTFRPHKGILVKRA